MRSFSFILQFSSVLIVKSPRQTQSPYVSVNLVSVVATVVTSVARRNRIRNTE